jgi:hypothetical protein
VRCFQDQRADWRGKQRPSQRQTGVVNVFDMLRTGVQRTPSQIDQRFREKQR